MDIIPPGQGGSNQDIWPKKNHSFIVLTLFFFPPNQIHAYNLETNYWEEIVTKPHQKIGLFSVVTVFLLETSEDLTVLTLMRFHQDIRLLDGVTAVFRSKMVSRISHCITWIHLMDCLFLKHTSRCLSLEVFICGGYNGEVILSDLWKLNLQTFRWSKLPAVMPEPAYFHCAAVTPVR